MRSTVTLVCAAAVLLASTPTLARSQTPARQPSSGASDAQKPAPQKPDPQKPDPQKPDPQKPDPKKPDPDKPEEPQRYEETIVVSASRTEQRLVNAPATMSVVTEAQIQAAPSQNFAELLRTTPGINITQVSARDINLTSRGATGTLATGQLALLDGRSIYQDFFGFVMWDFLPVNLNEIKQVEVVRGPASAVWGANAFNGVVNVITKSPREMQGSSAVMGFGAFGKANDEDAGSLWYISGTHAAAVNDRWAYKLSAGGYSQDPFSRPVGVIPCDNPDVCGGPRASYPNFTNQGTTQPKFDLRVDRDWQDGRNLSFSGGVAGTDGIMHTGIGPFDIDSGTIMAYGKASYTSGGFKASVFSNLLRGEATNRLSLSPLTGQPINFDFTTNTYDLEMSNVQTFAARLVVSYGGNVRLNFFDLSIAPSSDDREEFGVYAQDEIFLSDMFRWVVGARVDRFDFIDNLVFSPRTTFMIKPQDDHTIRVSYNRAYRSPSVINNHLNLVIAEPIDIRPLAAAVGIPPSLVPNPYALPINITGNTELDEQSMDAFELGYSAVLGRMVLSAAYYHNWVKNEILFTLDPTGNYTAANPPATWPLPPVLINFVPGASLPGRFTYLNFGESTQQGIELGINTPINEYVDVFANYSWQDEPKPKDFSLSELNLPATNRLNVGIGFNNTRFTGNLSVSYSDEAFWQDVLNAPYSGTTEAYTLVNAGFGVKWNDRFTTTIKAINLTDDDIQQHIFGDITKRQVVAELRVNFAR
jgi:outer membrane receptor protein involved in Fe transport